MCLHSTCAMTLLHGCATPREPSKGSEGQHYSHMSLQGKQRERLGKGEKERKGEKRREKERKDFDGFRA